jgi:hypothetical protein
MRREDERSKAKYFTPIYENRIMKPIKNCSKGSGVAKNKFRGDGFDQSTLCIPQ